MQDGFGVAVGLVAVACGFQVAAQIGMIEDLAVVDDPEVAGLIAHRLLAVRKADNAEPPRSQGQSRSMEIALLIRAAVHNRLRHPLNDAFRHASLPGQIQYACNTTHRLLEFNTAKISRTLWLEGFSG